MVESLAAAAATRWQRADRRDIASPKRPAVVDGFYVQSVIYKEDILNGRNPDILIDSAVFHPDFDVMLCGKCILKWCPV